MKNHCISFFLSFLMSKTFLVLNILHFKLQSTKKASNERVCVCLLADYPPPPPLVEDVAPVPSSSASFPPPPTNSYDFQVREQVFYFIIYKNQFTTSSYSACLSIRPCELIFGRVQRHLASRCLV